MGGRDAARRAGSFSPENPRDPEGQRARAPVFLAEGLVVGIRGELFDVEVRQGVWRRVVVAQRCEAMLRNNVRVLRGDRVQVLLDRERLAWARDLPHEITRRLS